jgi:acyl-CoA synthetase (AMP-forming)/AMP-acid ligase II
MALVEVRKGADVNEVCQRIYKYCHANAEERGRPVAVVPVEALPLTPMGKVDNKKLEAEYKNFDYISWMANHA